MKRSCLIVIFVVAVVLPVRVSWAQQLAPANEMGVRMCHLHLSAADPEASREFWLMVGGTLTTHGPAAPLVKFPGVTRGPRRTATSRPVRSTGSRRCCSPLDPGQARSVCSRSAWPVGALAG